MSGAKRGHLTSTLRSYRYHDSESPPSLAPARTDKRYAARTSNVPRVLFFLLGKRESNGGGSPAGNWPSSTGGPARSLNGAIGYGSGGGGGGGVGGAAGGINMTPDDPAPDEEFALAVTQKAQVSTSSCLSWRRGELSKIPD